MIQKLRLFLILPLFFYSCGVMESEYKPDIAIEIEHNLPVIDGVHFNIKSKYVAKYSLY